MESMWYSIISKEELYVGVLENFEFICWTTYDGVIISDINEYLLNTNKSYIDGKVKVYAKWEPIVYSVNYYGINGDIIRTDTYTVQTGFYLDESIVIEGYIILSWFDQNANILSEYNGMIGDVNCYPNYVKEKSVITFNVLSEVTGGIEATLEVESIIIEYGNRSVLPVPEIDGFEFIGWYNDGIQVTDSDGYMFHDITFSDDTVLVAKWVVNEYIVS